MSASLGASGELRQHAVAEAMHVVDRALQALRRAIAEQPHIDRADAEVLKPPDVPDQSESPSVNSSASPSMLPRGRTPGPERTRKASTISFGSRPPFSQNPRKRS